MRLVFSLPAYLLLLFAVLKVFVFPVTERTRSGEHFLVGMTTLQAVALVTMRAAWLRWVAPALERGARRLCALPRESSILARAVFVGVIIMAVAAAVIYRQRSTEFALPHPLRVVSTTYDDQPPPTSSEVLPPVVSALAKIMESPDFQAAARIIDDSVGTHKTWPQLAPGEQDRLCTAGTIIRIILDAFHGTPGNLLNHTQRAIYDMTAPPGRCP